MKTLFKVITLFTVVLMIAGCVEDEYYTTNGYYSRGSGVTTYYNDATVGYNRNYHPRYPRPYYRSPAVSAARPVSPQMPGNNGYSSSGSGTSRMLPYNPTIMSGAPGQTQTPGNNGYSSSGSGSTRVMSNHQSAFSNNQVPYQGSASSTAAPSGYSSRRSAS